MLEAEGKDAPAAEATAVHMSSTPQVQSVASVPSPVASAQAPASTAKEDEEDSEDESQILEESPCGRWQKRREEVGSEQAVMVLSGNG